MDVAAELCWGEVLGKGACGGVGGGRGAVCGARDDALLFCLGVCGGVEAEVCGVVLCGGGAAEDVAVGVIGEDGVLCPRFIVGVDGGFDEGCVCLLGDAEVCAVLFAEYERGISFL